MKSKNKVIALLFGALLAVSGWLFFTGRFHRHPGVPEQRKPKIYNGILDMEPPVAELEPRKLVEVHAIRLARQLYSSLVTYDNSFNIVGDLVSRWNISPDGKTYGFVLRDKIFFQDGTRLTAGDVVSCLGKLGREDSTQKELWRMVKEIKKIDDGAFSIELKRRFPPFLDFLTTVYASIAKPGAAGKGPEVVGTGPYRLADWQPGKLIRLKRNDLYYGERPKIDEINFFITTSPGEIGELAKKVPLDDLGWYNPPLPASVAKDYVELEIPALQTVLLCLNISRPPFKEPAFRKAFVKALDKKEFVSQVYPGVKIASGYLPLGLPGHNFDIPDSYFDAGSDAKILGKYRKKIDIVAGLNSGGDHAGEEARFHDTYRKFGADVSVRYLSDGDFLKRFLSGDYDGIKISNEADFPDAYGMLSYFSGSRPMTFLRGGDPRIDAMLAGAMAHTDRNERTREYEKIDKYIVDNFYAVPLYYNTRRKRFHKNLKGILPSLMGEHLFSIARLDIDD